jgi:hypothetical protein
MLRLAFERATTDSQAYQAHGDVKRLLAEAHEARPMLETYLQSLAERFGCAYEIGPVKTEKRGRAKGSAKFDGDMSGVCDWNRGMIIVPDDEPEMLAQLIEHHHPDNNPDIMQFKNKLLIPNKTGFRSCNVYLPMQNGHVSEVMILTRSMREVYAKTHKIHETASSLRRRFNETMPPETQARYASLLAKASRIHEAATPVYLRHPEFSLAA